MFRRNAHSTSTSCFLTIFIIKIQTHSYIVTIFSYSLLSPSKFFIFFIPLSPYLIPSKGTQTQRIAENTSSCVICLRKLNIKNHYIKQSFLHDPVTYTDGSKRYIPLLTRIISLLHFFIRQSGFVKEPSASTWTNMSTLRLKPLTSHARDRSCLSTVTLVITTYITRLQHIALPTVTQASISLHIVSNCNKFSCQDSPELNRNSIGLNNRAHE